MIKETIRLSQLTLDAEFQAILPVLDEEQQENLDALLHRDGIMDPLKAALIEGQHILLDGHNRLAWWEATGRERGDEEPEIRVLNEVYTRADARVWIAMYQLGRRNLTDAQRTKWRGKMVKFKYEQDQEAGQQTSMNQVATQVATEEEVSLRTVWNSVQFEEALEIITKHDPKAAKLIEDDKAKITQKQVIALAKKPVAEIRAACANLKAGRKWNDAGEPLIKKTPEKAKRETAVERKFKETKTKFATVLKTMLPQLRDYLVDIDQAVNGDRKRVYSDQWEEAFGQIYGQVQAWEPGAICPECRLKGCSKCGHRGWIRKSRSI